MEKFEILLGKGHPALLSIKERMFENPSEIQEKSIPEILKGNDVIAGASTGSGKTLAFAVGLIKNAQKDFGIQGLVLTPTRELAEQISEQISDFARAKDLDVIPVYGGVSILEQTKRLPYADIVIGTPGRILDHINRNSIDLSKVNTIVLDEADRMLDMGFIDDVDKIIKNCPKKRQTMLFSATISADIVRLSQKYLNNPVEISAEPHVDPSKLEQAYYDVEDGLKYSLLKHLIDHETSELVMIFCNTRRNVDFVANNLKATGIDALPIHGGYSQDKRNKILQHFHSNKVLVLVATDVAARGLDIKRVSHVYNYDIPKTKDEYIHRIGRTARAGKQGKVINIVTGRDYDSFQNLMQGDFNIKLEKTPFMKRIQIKWIPERTNFRGNRRGGNPRYSNNSLRDSRSSNSPRANYRYSNNSSRDSRSSNSPRANSRYSNNSSRDSRSSNSTRYSNNSRDSRRNNRKPRRY